MPLTCYYLLFVLCLPLLAWAQDEEEEPPGFILRPGRVAVDLPEHWAIWKAPTGARVIGSDGTVLPRLLRRDVNALVNVEQDTIIARVSGAGTNFVGAAAILDGDPETFWEPDPATEVDDWFVEVDLGQALIVQQVRVRFVDETQGDPFLKFRVMLSDGVNKAGARGNRLQFFRAGLVTTPNRDQREFVFDVEPQRPVPEGITGAIARFVRIDVLESSGPRGREISEREYALLPEDERGTVDYFLQTVRGREILLGNDPETYASLPEAERGPVRFYRRERPRLADIEVLAPGENIISITQSEKERVEAQGLFDFRLFRTLTDGNFGSFLDVPIYDPIEDENQVEIDLGAKYWLDRIKLLSPQNPPFAYQVRISNGSLDANGALVWTNFAERENFERFEHVEEEFPQQEVRFIELRSLEVGAFRRDTGTLSEIQAYGEGFVSEITMESPFIRLDRPRLFSRVTWDGDEPPNTRIEVRTRTGKEVTLFPHYFTGAGVATREISQDLWQRIPEAVRQPPVIEEITGPDWSSWSAPYAFSGEAFKSPSPRPLAKIQVRLLSDEPLSAAQIRSLHLHFDPPLVDDVLGEVWPAGDVEPGVEREFTLYLRPVFQPGNPGFDRLTLRSSSSTPIELLGVEGGDDAALRFGGGQTLWPGTLEMQSGDDGAISLAFPQTVRGGQTVYVLRFRTKVFLQSTVFSADFERDTFPGRLQTASSGNATSLVPSQSLVVVSRLESDRLIEDLRVVPPVFSPNGDGINDEAAIALTVLHLTSEKQLMIEVFDLSGRRVRDLSVRRANPSGEHLFSWDGRGDDGQLLAPGIYALRVSFAADRRGNAQAMRLVHLVY
jgi:hypothetical protein